MPDNHISLDPDEIPDPDLEEKIFIASFKTLYLLAERHEGDALTSATTAAAAALLYHYARKLGITSIEEDELFDRILAEIAQRKAEIAKNN